MARKKHTKKKSAPPPSSQGESNDTDDSGFAASLLSSMGVSPDQPVEDEAVDDQSFEDPKIKHPHLHSIHQSIKNVFKRSNSNESQASASSDANSNLNLSEASPENGSNPSASASRSSSTNQPVVNETKEALSSGDEVGDPKKRRNRRKEKLAERERLRARVVQEAQSEVDSMVDKRSLELKGMGMMISKAGLAEHEVQPDGHCLFHSLCDQLQRRRHIEIDYQELRAALAKYIRENPDDFVPYLIEEESGDVQDVEKYTHDLEHTPMWGGELEIMAASRLYKVPIKVYFGSQVPLTINEDQFPNEMPLTLAFYQDKYGLGAHYNSLRDCEPVESAEAKESSEKN